MAWLETACIALVDDVVGIRIMDTNLETKKIYKNAT